MQNQNSVIVCICRSSLVDTLDRFTKKAAPGSIILFYYAGHELVTSKGDHCLMTKDWDSNWPGSDDAAAEAAGYPVKATLQKILNAAPGCRLVALMDTCRVLSTSIPDRGEGLPASDMYAAAVHLEQSSCSSESLVCHAWRFGSVAADTPSGSKAKNGLYAPHLLQVWQSVKAINMLSLLVATKA